MSEENQSCPKCNSPYAYQDRDFWVCPECSHEWKLQSNLDRTESVIEDDSNKFIDANGVQLQTGDTVSTVKDLKVGKDTIKSGTKVKNIRLLDEPVDGHDISCKIPDFGSIYLKCSVVKKVN